MGKNEEKRLKAAAMKDFDSEMTEEQREAMLKKGMGIHSGGLQVGEEQIIAKKLTKEEKKAATEARRAALQEKKDSMAAMKAAQEASRKAAQAATEGGEASRDDGEGDEGEGGK